MEHKQELHPQVVIRDVKTREVLAHHAIPAGANLTVKDGETISAGTMVAKTPRKVAKTKDITGGLPRVAELFEARKPKDACTIARVEGIVRLSSKNTSRGKKVITIETPTGELVDHLVPMNKHVIVHEDDHVHMGDQLTEGPVSPEEILDGLRQGTPPGAPRQRSAGSVPPPGCGDQRQARGNHRAADAAQGCHHGTRQHRVPVGRPGGQDHL